MHPPHFQPFHQVRLRPVTQLDPRISSRAISWSLCWLIHDVERKQRTRGRRDHGGKVSKSCFAFEASRLGQSSKLPRFKARASSPSTRSHPQEAFSSDGVSPTLGNTLAKNSLASRNICISKESESSLKYVECNS